MRAIEKKMPSEKYHSHCPSVREHRKNGNKICSAKHLLTSFVQKMVHFQILRIQKCTLMAVAMPLISP